MRPPRIRQMELLPFLDMERLIPDTHILRLIDRYVDFSFIHDLVDGVYSDSTGRPAWDPEIMLRLLFLGYLYNLSERRLFEEASMHVAFRWFLGLTFAEPLPDRTTLVKLRTTTWAKIDAVDKILERVVAQCVHAGLVKGRHLTVDGTQIVANASIKSLEPVVVDYTPGEYMEELRRNDPVPPPNERQTSSGNPRPNVSAPSPEEEPSTPEKTPQKETNHPEDKDFRGERLSNQTHRSRTDPDARLYRKADGKEAKLSFIGSNLVDTRSRVILAVRAGTPGIHTESNMAVEMLDSLEPLGLLNPVRILTADTHYGNTAFLCALDNRGITPHIPLLFDATPEPLPVWKTRTFIPERQAKRVARLHKVQVRNNARRTLDTTGYLVSQKMRKRSEHLFAEGKVCHGLGRARGRGLPRVHEQLTFTAFVQNIKRLVSFRSRLDRRAAAQRLSPGALPSSITSNAVQWLISGSRWLRLSWKSAFPSPLMGKNGCFTLI
jgi:transposase